LTKVEYLLLFISGFGPQVKNKLSLDTDSFKDRFDISMSDSMEIPLAEIPESEPPTITVYDKEQGFIRVPAPSQLTHRTKRFVPEELRKAAPQTPEYVSKHFDSSE
jgi:hypothetical protein